MNNISLLTQWGLLIITSVLFIFFSPLAKTKEAFFKAVQKNKTPNALMLTGSLVISWIFAKSITNASNLGKQFGLVGGIAYAVYYLSFAVAGVIIYQLRTKGNYQSIHHFLKTKFGSTAIVVFSFLILIRLFNEVWSNTMVVGSFFGVAGSASYYTSITVFTVLTLAYALKGGLSSSIFTDAVQMILFAVLLAIVLLKIFSTKNFNLTSVANSSQWSMSLGGNLMIAAFIQIFSYPFHDSVLTDRGFISKPNTTLYSFLWASLLAFICILAFSLVGVFAKLNHLQGEPTVALGKLFGIGILSVVNFIMISSAASTLDSAFASASKLMAVDLNIKYSVLFGRLTMVFLALVGSLPVFFAPSILSATTLSGTMVIGLAPVFIFWQKDSPKISFYLSVLCGIIFGCLLVFKAFPSFLILSTGKYSTLLWVNIWGNLICFILYLIPVWIKKQFR
ncbi:MAG: sodium:solute symporter family transporter [Tenacibaculum sp.]